MEKSIYNRIKSVLAEKGKTNNWLAEEIGMNTNTISKWYRKSMQPRIENLFQVAKFMDVDLRELLVSTKK